MLRVNKRAAPNEVDTVYFLDHLKPEGIVEKVSEVQANYRNLSPVRPMIHKLKDHLKVSCATMIYAN